MACMSLPSQETPEAGREVLTGEILRASLLDRDSKVLATGEAVLEARTVPENGMHPGTFRPDPSTSQDAPLEAARTLLLATGQSIVIRLDMHHCRASFEDHWHFGW